MLSRLCLIALSLALLCAAPAAAAPACDRFAAGAGDDAGDGTQATPVRSIKRLMSLLGPAQTGCLKPGDRFHTLSFVDSGGTTAAPITLTSGPGEGRATVTGQIVFNGDHVRIRNVAFGGLAEIADYAPKTAHLLVNGDDVQVLDSDITSPKGICLDVGDIDGYASASAENGTTIRRADDFVLAGSIVHGCGVENWTDGDLTAQDSGVHGVYLVHTRRAVIRDNVIAGVINRGIQLWPRNEDALIEHNTLDGNGSNLNIGSSAEFGHFSTGTIVRDNLVTNATLRSATTPNFPHGDDAQIVGFFPDDTDRGNRITANCIYADYGADRDFHGRGFTATGNLRLDPGYVDRAAGDYRLNADSPCLGKGALPAVSEPPQSEPTPTPTPSPTPAATPTPLPSPGPAPPRPPPPATTPAPPAVSVPPGQTRRSVLRHGLRARVRCAEACTVGLSVHERSLQLTGRAAVTLRAAGARVARLRLTPVGRARLGSRRGCVHAVLLIRTAAATRTRRLTLR